MTREEAIKSLMGCEAETHCRHYAETFRCDGCNKRKALDMAIKALTAIEALYNADQHVQHVESVDLISRQDAFRTYQVKVCNGVACSECQTIEADGTCRIEAWLKDIPSADAVEVVMCKDCKYYKAKQGGLPWENSRRYCNRSVTLAMNPDDFCSFAERREP